MQRAIRLIILLSLLCLFSLPAAAQTRALLIACSDFITQPDLGSAISGNLHMIASTLLGADPALAGLSIEDGTIGTPEALADAISASFADANEDDLSILYLCTHGILSSADDNQAYLLLGNGETESPLSSAELYRQLSPIQGDKLLILDACFSGALLGRGADAANAYAAAQSFESPFLKDSGMHVLTSASASESSWYYDAEGLQSGAVSYFASALSSGLGLYGSIEADLNGDREVTLAELHRHLSAAVPSSSSQLLSSRAESIVLPAAQGAMLSRPLSGFSYGASLLRADDPTLDFSFTATRETMVQYRLIEYENGAWNWTDSKVFLDGNASLAPGRHMRSLTLPTVTETDSGYLMLQIFSVGDNGLLLCSERLIAVAPVLDSPVMVLSAPARFESPGVSEIPITASIGAPSEITVTVLDENGAAVRRLSAGQLTRPADENALHLFWDGRDSMGSIVPDGRYTLSAETFIGFSRVKATADLIVSAGQASSAPSP
ncbi:MAG: CHAT domain-containing protein [Clostridia bacterium]|nr:CHAT domain-containing protein [Clostridia bacterium]